MLTMFMKGFGLGAGLIVAIGAQNAHVLRSGLKRSHVGLTVAICIVCDVALIAAGIAGMGALIRQSPLLLGLARWGGAVFLAWYGVRALRAALRGQSLELGAAAVPPTARAAATTAFALTLLNPHVYLDTVVLLGAIGGQQPTPLRPLFAAGAMSASALWFLLLGYGARLLAPWFARPVAWRQLDGMIAAVMFALALSLALME